MFDYKVEKEIKAVGDKGKALRVVSWGGREAKLDLRAWRQDGENEKPGKGITLTEDEARDVLAGLQEYLAS